LMVFSVPRNPTYENGVKGCPEGNILSFYRQINWKVKQKPSLTRIHRQIPFDCAPFLCYLYGKQLSAVSGQRKKDLRVLRIAES
jgi:hypothetical protein